ncbi:MAG TPA: YCF48-related protein [Blastocatellia bacterium]|nr:YCF48-related protein [Blastocatellia bacterium]
MDKFCRLLILTLFTFSAFGVAGLASNSGKEGASNTGANGEVRRWEVTGPWGGDVRSLVASPDNADLLYLGTSDGQLFRSTDGARSWRRIKPGIDRRGLSLDNIVIDSRNTKTLYVGAWAVGEADNQEGVYKSEDGGETWKLLKETKGMHILSIALAPSDSNYLVAGSPTGVFRSTDGGDDWERISPEGHKDIRGINSVAIDPRNTNIIYAGTHHLPWKTTDGGVTWKQTGYKEIGMIDDSDIMGISVNPVEPTLVYMNACSGIYRSTSAGEKWAKLPGIPFSARRTYALTPHPTLPDVIFAGTSEGLWRSKDGGKRWMLLTSKSAVLRSVVIHPTQPGRVIIATDDFGVQMSDNLGDSFRDANNGFIHRHILAIAPDIAERGRLLASVYHDGSSGSVFMSQDGGESWQSASRGLGTRDVFAFYQMPNNPNVIYAGTNTGVYRSNDRGMRWAFVGKEKPVKETPAKKPARRRNRASLNPTAPELVPALYTSSNTVGQYMTVAAQKKSKKAPPKKSTKKRPTTPKVVEPLGPPMIELTRQVDDITSFIDAQGRVGLMAATMDGLYRTVDETKGWEKVYISGYNPTGRVFSVSSHKNQPNKIYAGTREGLYVSNDGGMTWQAIERGPNEASVKSIAQDPRDPDLIILGTNQFIFRSTNGGRTWVKRGGGLQSGDYTSVVFNPANPDEIMVSEYSRGGIYRSSDKGYSWERIDTELPSNRVWTLTFDPFDRDRMYAGSFSSGVYVLTIQRRGSASSSQ